MRDYEEVSAGSTADAILYSSVVISLFFNHWIIIQYFIVRPTVLRYPGVWYGEDDAS